MTIYFIVSKSQKQSVVLNNLTIIVGEGVSRVGSGVNSRGNSVDSGVGGRYMVGNSVVSNSGGRDQSRTMSIVNSSHHSSGSLSMSNLLKGVRFSLSLAIGVDKRIAGVDTSNMMGSNPDMGVDTSNMMGSNPDMGVDTWNNSVNSSGWDRGSSMSIADGSDDSAISLSSSNLANSVWLGLSLAISMDIGIAGVDTSSVGDCSIGIARVDTSSVGDCSIGIARVDTGSIGNWDNTNCLDTSLNSIGNHSNIVSTAFSQGVLDWKTSSHLGNGVGLGIPRGSSNGQTNLKH